MNSLTVHFGLISSFIQTINSISVPLTHLFLHKDFVCYILHYASHRTLNLPFIRSRSFQSIVFPKPSVSHDPVCKLAASLLNSYLVQCYCL